MDINREISMYSNHNKNIVDTYLNGIGNLEEYFEKLYIIAINSQFNTNLIDLFIYKYNQIYNRLNDNRRENEFLQEEPIYDLQNTRIDEFINRLNDITDADSIYYMKNFMFKNYILNISDILLLFLINNMENVSSNIFICLLDQITDIDFASIALNYMLEIYIRVYLNNELSRTIRNKIITILLSTSVKYYGNILEFTARELNDNQYYEILMTIFSKYKYILSDNNIQKIIVIFYHILIYQIIN